MPKNPADDCSLEQLKHNIAEVFYLSNGIEARKKKIEELGIEIKKEMKRLTKQGYDFTKEEVTVFSHVEH